MLEGYLKKIGLLERPSNTAEGLLDLHKAQVFSIPFENLSVFLGEKVSLEPTHLEAKLLQQRRGGYCFELNGLFAWALGELGFPFQTHLARVKIQSPTPGPLTHQLNLVHVSNRDWLCDVGFGGPSIRFPMPFELDRVEAQDGDEFRLRLDSDFGYALEQKQDDGTWATLYLFQLNRAMPIDITMANHFVSTWEDSIFRKSLLLARPIPGGKITLYHDEMRQIEKGAVSPVVKVTSGANLLTLLSEKFNIHFSEGQSARVSAEFDKRAAGRATLNIN